MSRFRSAVGWQVRGGVCFLRVRFLFVALDFLPFTMVFPYYGLGYYGNPYLGSAYYGASPYLGAYASPYFGAYASPYYGASPYFGGYPYYGLGLGESTTVSHGPFGATTVTRRRSF